MVAHGMGLGLALPVNYLYELPGVKLPMASPPPDFARWQAIQARAKRDEEREAEEARAAFSRPGLAGASVGPTGAVFAIVVARGRPAGALPFTFDLIRDGKTVCRPTAIVEGWDFYQKVAPQTTQDSRYLRWLKKQGLTDDVFVGTAPLRMESCPSVPSVLGGELVLPGTDPVVGRAVIGMYREVR